MTVGELDAVAPAVLGVVERGVGRLDHVVGTGVAGAQHCHADADGQRGSVKLEGEVWTARPLDENDSYEPGEQVTVMHIDGATAVVWRNA